MAGLIHRRVKLVQIYVYTWITLAGTLESPRLMCFEGRNSNPRGIGSVEAMQEGSKDRYFQNVEDIKKN
jgi:IMP dehydrogenase/GMP reductase